MDSAWAALPAPHRPAPSRGRPATLRPLCFTRFASGPKEGRPCAIRLERSPPAGPIPASVILHLGSVQPRPPASRKNASPVAASDWKRAPRRPPARRTDATPPCNLQTEGANAQTPIRLRSRASLDCIQGRAASSMKTSLSPEARVASPSERNPTTANTAPSDLNVFRYGNARRRTIQVGANRSPVEASDWWVSPGSAASQATPSFQRDRRAVLPPGVIANSTAVRFGREGKLGFRPR